MSQMSFSELRCKDVINVCDGTRLGTIAEIEFDSCNGQICSLILCSGSGFFSFKHEQRIVLPWSRIECIGDYAVLVKLSQNDLKMLEQCKRGRKE
jgi:YlmC/YmxH family sporulation protein